MTGYGYGIKFAVQTETVSPTDLGKRFLKTLDRIALAAPEIGSWTIVDLRNGAKLLPIDEARESIAKLVEDNVTRDDYGEPDLDFGYRLLGVNTPKITSRSLSWSTSAARRFDNLVKFRVGYIDTPSDPEVVTYSLFRTVMLTTIALWPSVWANAYAFRRDYDEVAPAPGIPPHPGSRYLLPWISYLPAPLADNLVLPEDIPTERTPDGGLLMIATKERLEPTDPEQMRRSRKIAEIMIERAGDPGSEGPPAQPFELGQ